MMSAALGTESLRAIASLRARLIVAYGWALGLRDPVGAAREVRWIDHGQHDIHLVDEHLPPLADSHVGGIGRGQPEDIGRNANSARLECRANEPELIANDLRA
jgi:hypothetical protein